ncbi:nitrile hydratase accessory protein [Methylobacterium sp. 174MFSha1.1]|uniref:nitrile hydratase accessory protein n=1 Tax=Methylobacterium sp. 174MFSha1.1 TaxID=1502749 RepID=UPI0008E3AAD1|nr:nitrile hydratase accessory protein [Methylobacterium sp. 174MFSha1.1]SFV02592.1 nitrile hydratase accessory protein [Methylobacterium sp. 174MFSha1.1]
MNVPHPSRPPEPPVFAAPWEAQTFALVVSLHDAGLFTWGEWAQALGRAGDRVADYALWLETIEALLAERGLTSAAALEARRAAFARAAAATPHGEPIRLENDPGPA